MAKVTTGSLAASIRKARLRAGVSQQIFAEKLGIKQGRLSEWERGIRLRNILEAISLLTALGKAKKREQGPSRLRVRKSAPPYAPDRRPR